MQTAMVTRESVELVKANIALKQRVNVLEAQLENATRERDMYRKAVRGLNKRASRRYIGEAARRTHRMELAQDVIMATASCGALLMLASALWHIYTLIWLR